MANKIDGIFDDLLKRGGSDLHLTPGFPPLARVRGDLLVLRDGALDAAETEEILLELMTPPQRARLQADLDVDFAVSHREAARFRASVFHKANGLGAVFRAIPPRVLTLSELGSPEVLWRLADRRAGLVLVVGPTAAGKTTTLAAMIDHVNKTRACHVLTIEDPIEFVHEPLRAQVTHREVGVHAPRFESALDSAGRENADVVLVSELRTPAAARRALDLACGGVLVLSTVHASGAVQAIDQIIAAEAEPDQPSVRAALADSLAGIVAQQLVRGADGKRVAAHEVLVGSPAVSSLIRDGKTSQLLGVMQAGQGQGMQTMDMSLERLMTSGRIKPEDALERAADREGFSRIVSRIRPDLVDPA